MQLKLLWDLDGINENQDFPENEIDQSGGDCIENHINDIFQNIQPLDDKPVEKQPELSNFRWNISYPWTQDIFKTSSNCLKIVLSRQVKYKMSARQHSSK